MGPSPKADAFSLGRALEYSQRENIYTHQSLYIVLCVDGLSGILKIEGSRFGDHDDLYSQVGSPSESII